MNRATVIQDAVDLARRHAQPVVVFEYGDGMCDCCCTQTWERIIKNHAEKICVILPK